MYEHNNDTVRDLVGLFYNKYPYNRRSTIIIIRLTYAKCQQLKSVSHQFSKKINEERIASSHLAQKRRTSTRSVILSTSRRHPTKIYSAKENV